MINSAHMVKFQEQAEDSIMQETVRSLPRKATKFSARQIDEN